MIKKLGVILGFIVFTQIVIGENICENTAPLETIFTLDSVTYARKGEMFYRTEISKSLSDGEEKHYTFIFQSASDKLKFVRIDTGFMITRIPKCDASDDNCKEVNKLKGMAFVMGTAKSPFNSNQAYKLYRSIKINRFPALNPASGGMPFNLETESEIGGSFWPKSASDTVKYMHSTYDERSFSIVHIIFDSGNLVLYYYSLANLKAVPDFAFEPIDQQIKGFFHRMSVISDDPHNRTAPNSVRVISKSDETDTNVILDFGEDFKFRNSSISLFDIYGCKVSESTASTTASSKASTRTESTFNHTSGSESIGSTQKTTELSTNTTAKHSSNPSKNTGLMIWLLIVLGVVVLIIIAILIVCGFCHKNAKKEKSREVGTASNKLASNASTTGSPVPEESSESSENSKIAGEG